MPVSIRNPFRKVVPPTLFTSSSDSAALRHSEAGSSTSSLADDESRSTPATSAPSKATSAISIIDEERNSYKMSVVNDSGIYLPPSPPPEKKSFWRRNESSNSVRNRQPITPSGEQFTISRESFDSYRRSFDISARSPISDVYPTSGRPSLDPGYSARPTRSSFDIRPNRMSFDNPPRMSLDARRSPNNRTPEALKEEKEPETEFEDVKLDEETRPSRNSKLNIFHRFDKPPANGAPGNGHHRTESGMTRFFGGKKPETPVIHESELNSIGGSPGNTKTAPVSAAAE
ncbi:hypothetical protein EX30DRAFT_339667 [Ascodesmis nigricans]|uniref:Uncharacterized protein n=1 Tax=Ascodesmis nigricans TaxID=341454 RepID=A0A4S2MZX1_9PEZI|nr:hypothetical protein EX30DRAFT_339667 [Ascodesmis nigricans]